VTRLETLILESMSCQRWLNAVSRSSTISSCRLLRLISSTATSRSSSTCDVSRLRSVTSFYTRTQLSINQSTSITLLSCSEKKTLAFHRLFSRVVLSTSHVHQDMFSTFHVNLDQLIPSQLTSSLINRNSGISGKGFYSYMHFLLINQQCCSTL